LEGITKVKSHISAFGRHDSDHQEGGLVKKPTSFMMNANEIAEELDSLIDRPCSGDHRQVLIGGGRARKRRFLQENFMKIIYLDLGSK